jgi:hypothetical protein
MRNAGSILVGKPKGKRQRGKPKFVPENNIENYLRQAGCGGMDWIGLAKDRDQWRALVNTVMNLRVP